MTEHDTAADRLRATLTTAAAENRARAFLYRWLELLERTTGDAEPLRELLADDLVMTLPDGRVLRDHDEVAAWYDGTRAAVRLSLHHVRGLTVTPGPGRTYDLAVDFDWQGIAVDGSPMTARTRHAWTLTDTGESHLRLSRFTVTAVEPFTPVPAEQALAHFTAARTA
ncbi:DUF4440 domain-containing protein [Kitasatospora sp. NPDC089797]|uniref:DUF4440 domain-containing protein n=1 Tax=Kitasatospora sp. NPDC089797 TaxID=3155298 RepID=UPI003429246D